MAQRTALFPESIRSQATVWRDQDRIFNKENAVEAQRPIWIHAGDSIATAWGTRATLKERIQVAEFNELPVPGQIQDLLQHFPKASETWYAGSQIDFGLFGWLQRTTHRDWLIVSTALAGAKLGKPSEDPLSFITQVKNPNRVKLLTFSLGSNDECDDLDPAHDPVAFEKRLQVVKDFLPPNTPIVAWDLPDIQTIKDSILKELDALPDSIGKRRMISYCKRSWDVAFCPAASAQTREHVAAIRKSITDSYKKVFGNLYDPFTLATDGDLLDHVAGDCFHPSRLVQKTFTEGLERHLSSNFDF